MGYPKRPGRVAAAAVLIALLAPASAHAALTWSPANGQELSAAGAGAHQMKVATDASGNAIAVWIQSDSNGIDRVAVAPRPAGNTFGNLYPPTYISDTSGDSTTPDIAMNANGDAIVTWLGNSGQAEYSIKPGGGSWSEPKIGSQVIGNTSEVSSPKAGIDAAGDAFLAWFDPAYDHVYAAFKPAGSSSFGNPQYVNNLAAGNGAGSPALAVSPAGDAAVMWLQHASNVNRPEAAFRPAGGDPSYPDAADFGPVDVLSGAVDSTNPTVAMDANGNALFAFQWTDNSRFPPQRVSVQYRRKSDSSYTGTDLDGGGVWPSAAFDPSGNAFLVWDKFGTYPNPDEIVAAYRPLNGSFGAPTPVSTGLHSGLCCTRVGVDSQGRPAAIWLSYDNNRENTVQASSRAAGPGPFAPPVNLSPPGDLGDIDAGFAELAVSAAGQAIAVWPMLQQSPLDGGLESIAHAAFGTPPEDKPPPPPPPPPPAVPTNIVAAAPFEGGKAIVLTAKVKGPVESLQWHFKWKGHEENPTVIGRVIDGQLQDSVRLHPDQRTFTATVKAFGPGQDKTYSRTITLPKAPKNNDIKQIQSALDQVNADPVFAAGYAENLLGDRTNAAGVHRASSPGCGITTVFSSKKEISGCMKPVNRLPNIPDREKGVIKAMADKLGIDPANEPLVKEAMTQVDGYLSEGQTMLDNNWPVVPKEAADVLAFPQAQTLTSSSASLEIAGQKFGASSKGFSMDLDPKKLDIPLGDLPKPPKLPSIGGFELVGDWNIDLQKREAIIKASLKLPSWITTAGISVQNEVTLKATPDHLELQGVKVGPMSVKLGGSLGVSDFKLTYDKVNDEWTGQAKACPIANACLDMVPPNGEIKIKHGQLNFAGASIDFPPPGIPLFTGVNLERLGFGIGLDPTRITGNGRISVVKIVKLDGRLVLAFPSERTPFRLLPDEVGGGYPQKLYGTVFTRPTIGATAAVIVSIPVLGEIELGHGYFLYQFPSYIAVGGGIDVKVLDIIEVDGGISGEMNLSDKTVNLHGDIHACLLIKHKVCGGVVANISRGPGGIGGAGGCINIGPVSVGGGVQWNRITEPFIWPFDGCKWSRFAIDVNASRAAASNRVTMKVVKGKPSPALKIFGKGDAPLVRVAGPGGQSLSSTDKGLDVSPNKKIRILRYQGKRVSFTVVGLQNEAPGTYTITAMPGSVPFGKIERATDQPDAKVSGHVTGKGSQRVLTYRVAGRPAQIVTFFDVGEGGTAKKIGAVTGGGRGKISFSPAPGRKRRQIVAQFTLQGLNAERRTVTTFQPPPLLLPRPHGLRVKRQKGTLTISWQAVRGAQRYELAVSNRTGYQKRATTTKHKLTVKKVPRSVSGFVALQAVDLSRHSPTVLASFKRVHAPISRIHHLGHCKVKKKKISCKRG